MQTSLYWRLASAFHSRKHDRAYHSTQMSSIKLLCIALFCALMCTHLWAKMANSIFIVMTDGAHKWR